MRSPRRVGLIGLLVVSAGLAAASPATSGLPRQAGAPSSLCTLKVAVQLKALGVAAKCAAPRTSTIGSLRMAGASWGSATSSIGVTVYSGLSEARFKAQFGSLGSPVSLGSFAREASGPSGVALSAWVGGVGLAVNLRHPGSTAANNAYKEPVLAFAKAVARQI